MMSPKENQLSYIQKKGKILFDNVIDDFMLQQQYQVKQSTYAH